MEKLYFTNKDWLKLCWVLSKANNSNQIVTLSHWRNSSKDSSTYINLERKLNQEWYNTFRFDLSWHWESEWHIDDFNIKYRAEDMISAINFLKIKWFENIISLWSSISWPCLLRAIASKEDMINNYILYCPWNKSENYPELHNICEKINIGWLIIHWSEDEVVPVERWKEIDSHLLNSKLEIVEWANHNFTEHREIREKLTIDYLKNL